MEQALDHLVGTPEFKMLKNMIWSHKETLQAEADDYFHKDVYKDLANRASTFEDIWLDRDECVDGLKEILYVIHSSEHKRLTEFVARFEAREKKIKAVTQEMLAYIDRCKRRGKFLEWKSELPLIEREDEDFDHYLKCNDNAAAEKAEKESSHQQQKEDAESKPDDEDIVCRQS